MIYIPSLNKLIQNPNEHLTKEVKNFLFENLDKGYVIFITPEDFDILPETGNVAKNHKKNYKVGFLYDMLTVVYPSYSKSKKHLIISNKYHLWCTYRQLFTIINDYTVNRDKYLKNRKELCI